MLVKGLRESRQVQQKEPQMAGRHAGAVQAV